jgi:predicted molibdopterin-dependent oxidoreductase YjgC
VQGACDMGSLPNVYPGYQKLTDPIVRNKFETAWNIKLSTNEGLSITETIDSILKGKIKALYLIGENPMLSDPDISRVRKALSSLEFFIAQDIFLNESAELAHVVLPGASFAEKDGTFTNTERRVQRVRKAIEPIGNSRADWLITCQIAQRMGAKGFDFKQPSHIMDEIAELTPSYGGISYKRLEKGGIQWPCPTIDHPGTQILHTQQFTRGKGKFIPIKYKQSAELPDDDYPLILTTGRSLFQYHTGTMTRKVEGLNKFKGEEEIEINPKDAITLSINDGDIVKVISRRGEITTKVKITDNSSPGVVFMTFHFAESPTNVLTNTASDPISKIPELKVCSVRIEKVFD